MNSIIRFLARSLVPFVAMFGFASLRPAKVTPDYSEQLTLCVILDGAGDQTGFEVRWRVYGYTWQYEPVVTHSEDWGIQCWIPNLAPSTWFEIEARSINGTRVSDWDRTMMRTLD